VLHRHVLCTGDVAVLLSKLPAEVRTLLDAEFVLLILL
jgi:hypothetical protein